MAAINRTHPRSRELQALAAELGPSNPIGHGRWPARSPALADWGGCRRRDGAWQRRQTGALSPGDLKSRAVDFVPLFRAARQRPPGAPCPRCPGAPRESSGPFSASGPPPSYSSWPSSSPSSRNLSAFQIVMFIESTWETLISGSALGRLGWGLQFCISNRHLGAAATGPRTTLCF